MKKKEYMVLALLQSEHFTFTALGRTGKEARDNMKALWDAHIREYMDGRGEHRTPFSEYEDGVWYIPMAVGDGVRDGGSLVAEGGKGIPPRLRREKQEAWDKEYEKANHDAGRGRNAW